MATHNDRIIETTKNRVIVLENGKLKEDRRKKGGEIKAEHKEQVHAKEEEKPTVEIKKEVVEEGKISLADLPTGKA